MLYYLCNYLCIIVIFACLGYQPVHTGNPCVLSQCALRAGKMPVSVGLAPGGLYKVVYKITALRTHRNCLNQLWPWLPCTGPAGAAAAAGRHTAAAHTGNFWRLMWSNWSITLHLGNLYYFRMLDEGQDLQPRPHRRSYSSNFEASKANVNFPHLKARRW